MAAGDRAISQTHGGMVLMARVRGIGTLLLSLVARAALAATLSLLLATPRAAQHAKAAGAAQRTASLHLYWTNDGAGGVTIGRALLDGTQVDNHFIVGGTDPERLCGVAVAGTYLYWGIDGSSGSPVVGRARLDGTEVNQDFLTGAGNGPVCGVATYGRYLYWAAYMSDFIGRANLDGTGVNEQFIGGMGVYNPVCYAACSPSGLAVDGAHIYWGAVDSIGRANLDGTHVQPAFITGLNFADAVAVTSTYIYWTDQGANNRPGAIGRARLDGTAVQRSFITGKHVAHPCGLAVTDKFIYWGQYGAVANTLGVGGTLARANLDGTGVQARFITGLDGPCGLAVGP